VPGAGGIGLEHRLLSELLERRDAARIGRARESDSSYAALCRKLQQLLQAG
jgi:hypothetical protein